MRNLRFEKLNQRNLMTADICFPALQPEECGEPTWHNYAEPTDVNNQGETTVLDALVILNEMARGKYTDSQNNYQLVDPASVDPHPELFYDVNNDGRASALDALLVINYISRQQNSHGEGELPITDGSGQQVVPVTYFHDQSMREEETWLSYQPL